ncbi:MAG: oligosaccharide flippase family protein [Pirellulales bacterium]
MLDTTKPPLKPAGLDITEPQSTPAPPAGGGLFSRLAGATLNYGIGGILPQLISFLLIPLYTAFLSPADYGILELASTLGATTVILMRCGVPGALTLYYFDFGERSALTDYVTTIARAVNVTSIAVGLLILAIAPWTIAPWMELPWYPFVILVVAIQLLSSNSDLQRRLIQAREQSAYSAKLSLAFSLSNIALAVLFVAGFRWGAVGMLLAQLCCAAVFFVQAQRYLRPNLGGRFRRDMLRSSFNYGLGILPSHLLTTMSPLLTRVILTQVDSLAAVGLFALATRMASPLTGVLVTAFNMAYLPLYFSIRKEATESGLLQLAATSRHVWLAALFCFLGVALLGPPAIVLMTPDRYHDAAPLVPILCMGFLAQTLHTLLGPDIFYAKRTWLVPIVTGSSLATTLVAAAMLAPSHGAVGIAWATSFGSIAGMITAVYFSLQTVSVPHDWWGLIRAGGATVVVFVGGYWAGGSLPWQQAAAGAAALVVFPILLWLARDRAIRETWQHGRALVTRNLGRWI